MTPSPISTDCTSVRMGYQAAKPASHVSTMSPEPLTVSTPSEEIFQATSSPQSPEGK